MKLPFVRLNNADGHLQISDGGLAVTAITDPGTWPPCREHQSWVTDGANRQRKEEPYRPTEQERLSHELRRVMQ